MENVFTGRILTALSSVISGKIQGIRSCCGFAGIAGIPNELIEASRVDGANRFQCLIFVKLPLFEGECVHDSDFVVLNSMKIYREAYLVGGSYPNKDIYLLQHTFNNWYVNLEFDKMAAASVLVAVVLFVFILLFQYYSQR